MGVDFGYSPAYSVVGLQRLLEPDPRRLVNLGAVTQTNGDTIMYFHQGGRYLKYNLDRNSWREVLWTEVPHEVGGGLMPRDSQGRRISVPDPQMIDQVGALARQFVQQGLTLDVDAVRRMQEELNTTAYEPPDVREVEEQEWDVARTTTTRRRRTTTPGRATVAGPTTKNDPIYTWGMQSSRPRNGGEYITYEVRLNDDGSLSCNCPGWIFKKNTSDRGCKHTRHPEVVANAQDYYERHQRGEKLPMEAPTAEQLERVKNSRDGKKAAEAGKNPTEGFGRFVELD